MIEQGEKLHSKEQQSSAQFDAILVHGYWMSQKGEHTSMALRTHFAARAVALTYYRKGAGKIVIDLGHLWGPDYPSEGSVIANALETKYHIPHEAIILREEGYSTFGEVNSALELARENGWTRLADVAFGAHRKTIRGIYENKDNKELMRSINVSYEAVEDILSQDDQRVREKLAGLGKSKYRLFYEAYEALKWTRMHLPLFDYKKLDQANKDTRTEPTEVWIPPVIGKIPGVARAVRIDKYKLPEDTQSKAA